MRGTVSETLRSLVNCAEFKHWLFCGVMNSTRCNYWYTLACACAVRCWYMLAFIQCQVGSSTGLQWSAAKCGDMLGCGKKPHGVWPLFTLLRHVMYWNAWGQLRLMKFWRTISCWKMIAEYYLLKFVDRNWAAVRCTYYTCKSFWCSCLQFTVLRLAVIKSTCQGILAYLDIFYHGMMCNITYAHGSKYMV